MSATCHAAVITDDQRRLLAELDAWKILALADMPEYWCKHIREGQGFGSVLGDWPAGTWRSTYPWGIAITSSGDYLRDRKRDDPAHAATVTWAQITRWVESLPTELRAEARRNRKAERDVEAALAARIIAHTDVPTAAEELTLW
ncbi:hypothetical protein [Rhodococcus sp. NPDC003348]